MAKVTVEIYERATGKIIETMTVEKSSFELYWTMQCDPVNYGYKVVEP